MADLMGTNIHHCCQQIFFFQEKNYTTIYDWNYRVQEYRSYLVLQIASVFKTLLQSIQTENC